MNRSTTTIVALGILTAIFMAIMSVVYLGQIPTQADLDGLEPVLRRQHGIYLSSADPVELRLIMPQDEGDGIGVRVRCVLRPDLRRRAASVELHLGRIAQTVLESPELEGRIAYVTCEHATEPRLAATRHAARPEGAGPASPATAQAAGGH